MIVDAILLAAGSSRRFGSDKRMHPVQGVPMLQCTLSIFLAVPALRSVYVVLRHSDVDQLQYLLGPFTTHARVVPLLLDRPDAGMGSNLARAVQQLPADRDAVFVALADMPFVQKETLALLLAAGDRQHIVAPYLRCEDGSEQRGHPVLFPRAFFPGLTVLQGDRGARELLQHSASMLKKVMVSDEGVLRDGDTPAALAAP